MTTQGAAVACAMILSVGAACLATHSSDPLWALVLIIVVIYTWEGM